MNCLLLISGGVSTAQKDIGPSKAIKSPAQPLQNSSINSLHTPRASLRLRKRRSSDGTHKKSTEATPKTPDSLLHSILSPPPSMNASRLEKLHISAPDMAVAINTSVEAAPVAKKGKSDALNPSKQDKKAARQGSDSAGINSCTAGSIGEQHVFRKPASQVVLKSSKNVSFESPVHTPTTTHRSSQSKRNRRSLSSQRRSLTVHKKPLSDHKQLPSGDRPPLSGEGGDVPGDEVHISCLHDDISQHENDETEGSNARLRPNVIDNKISSPSFVANNKLSSISTQSKTHQSSAVSVPQYKSPEQKATILSTLKPTNLINPHQTGAGRHAECDKSVELYSEPMVPDDKTNTLASLMGADDVGNYKADHPSTDNVNLIVQNHESKNSPEHVKETFAKPHPDPVNVVPTHNMTNDSFVMDTQTLNLIASFSPTMEGFPVNTMGQIPLISEAVDMNERDVNEIGKAGKVGVEVGHCEVTDGEVGVSDRGADVSGNSTGEFSLSVCDAGVLGGDTVRTDQSTRGLREARVPLAEGTPSMYSDLEHDSTADEYINNYCTQGAQTPGTGQIFPDRSHSQRSDLVESPRPVDHRQQVPDELITVKQGGRECTSLGMDDATMDSSAEGSSVGLNGGMSVYNSMTDVSGGQDEAMLCSSFIEQGEDGQQVEQLLPASCYDRQAPATYDREQPDSCNRLRPTGSYNHEPGVPLTDPDGVDNEPQSVINNIPFQSFADTAMTKRTNVGKIVANDVQDRVAVNYLRTNRKSLAYGNLSEDMEIAMNMSDSFSCSDFIKNEEKHIHKTNKIDPAANKKLSCDNLATMKCAATVGHTSLTLSMLQRELDLDSQMDFGDIVHQTNGDNIVGQSKVQEPANEVVVMHTPARKAPDHSIEFSPEMTALLDAMCDDITPVKATKKRAPKRTRKAVVHPQNMGSPFTPPSTSIVPSCKGKKRRSLEKNKDSTTSKSQKSSTQHVGNDISHNDSVVSDCVPPTPPRADDLDKSKVSTPQRLLGGVVSTPQKETPRMKSSENVTPRSQIVTRMRNKPDTVLSLDARPSVSVKSKSNEQSITTPQSKAEATGRLQQSPAIVSQLLPQSLPFTNQSFTIIDVAANKTLFEYFIEEWSTKPLYALCVACEKLPPQVAEGPVIGGNFKKGDL